MQTGFMSKGLSEEMLIKHGKRSYTGKVDKACALTSLSQNLHKVESVELAVCLTEISKII